MKQKFSVCIRLLRIYSPRYKLYTFRQTLDIHKQFQKTQKYTHIFRKNSSHVQVLKNHKIYLYCSIELYS